MKDGVKTKFEGRKEEIEALIKSLEKENLVIKHSDFLDNDKDSGFHIFVTVLPKQVVTSD